MTDTEKVKVLTRALQKIRRNAAQQDSLTGGCTCENNFGVHESWCVVSIADRALTKVSKIKEATP